MAIRFAAVSVGSAETVEDALQTVAENARLAAENATDVLVLSQFCIGNVARLPATDEARAAMAQDPGSPFYTDTVDTGNDVHGVQDALVAIAHDHNLYLVVGVVERVGRDFFSTAVVVSPDGSFPLVHRTTVLSRRDSKILSLGDTPPWILDMEIRGTAVRLAVLIGHEACLPALYQILFAQEVRVVVVLGGCNDARWPDMMHRVAGWCHSYVVASARPPTTAERAHAKRDKVKMTDDSMVLGPFGDLIESGPSVWADIPECTDDHLVRHLATGLGPAQSWLRTYMPWYLENGLL